MSAAGKGMALAIMKKMGPPEGSGEEEAGESPETEAKEEDSGMDAVSGDLIDAFHQKDAAAVSSALRDAFEILKGES